MGTPFVKLLWVLGKPTSLAVGDTPKPYKFIGFGDIYGPKPYKFIGFGDIYGPKPYKFTGFGQDDLKHGRGKFMWPDQEMVTKLPWNWSPGLILGAFCTIFRARPVGTGLGAKFGRKTAQNRPKPK